MIKLIDEINILKSSLKENNEFKSFEKWSTENNNSHNAWNELTDSIKEKWSLILK